jgi:gliding motility-associated-like protein
LFISNFITVNALPTIVTSPDTAICIGDTVNLTASGGTTYLWNNGLGSGNVKTDNPTTPTTYTVYVTNANLCLDSAQINVTINSLPTITASADTTICTGDAVNLSVNGGLSYIWDNSLGSGQTHSPTPITSTTYHVIGIDANSCTNSDSVVVTVGTCGLAPVSSFSASDSTICIGSCINFTDLSQNLPTTWTWYFFGSNTLNSNNQNPTNICYNSAGTFDVALVTTNTNGTDSLFIPNFITVFNLPVVTTSPDTSICRGSAVNLSASGAVSYIWNNGLGAGQNQSPTPLTPTTYTVTGTDINNCSNSSQVNVGINALPTITTNPDDTTVCIGDTVRLRATGAFTYNWDNGLGNIQNTIATPVVPTIYTVIGTDTNGCVNTAQVNVGINALPIIVASNDDTICSGDTTIISASGGFAYSWDHGLSPTPSVNPNEIVFPTITTTYTVTGIDNKGCRNTDQVTVTVNSLPTVIANASDTVICLGDSVTLIGSGANNYVWYNNYGLIQPTVIFPTQGGWYLVQGTDTNGCKNTDRVIVTVNTCTIPATNFNASGTTICMNNCIDFTDLSSSATPLFTWTWYFVGANPSSSTDQNPINICYNNVGSYDVALVTTNSLGPDSLFIPNYITVDSCIISPTITPIVIVPNVFSPNGDGRNDTFKVDGIEIKNVAMKIYNRWGQTVFESSQAIIGWNGRTNSNIEVPDGTYFYIIDVETDKTVTYTGSLTLIR